VRCIGIVAGFDICKHHRQNARRDPINARSKLFVLATEQVDGVKGAVGSEQVNIHRTTSVSQTFTWTAVCMDSRITCQVNSYAFTSATIHSNANAGPEIPSWRTPSLW
jgi:hypothetical protein